MSDIREAQKTDEHTSAGCTIIGLGLVLMSVAGFVLASVLR